MNGKQCKNNILRHSIGRERRICPSQIQILNEVNAEHDNDTAVEDATDVQLFLVTAGHFQQAPVNNE